MKYCRRRLGGAQMILLFPLLFRRLVKALFIFLPRLENCTFLGRAPEPPWPFPRRKKKQGTEKEQKEDIIKTPPLAGEPSNAISPSFPLRKDICYLPFQQAANANRQEQAY